MMENHSSRIAIIWLVSPTGLGSKLSPNCVLCCMYSRYMCAHACVCVHEHFTGDIIHKNLLTSEINEVITLSICHCMTSSLCWIDVLLEV